MNVVRLSSQGASFEADTHLPRWESGDIQTEQLLSVGKYLIASFDTSSFVEFDADAPVYNYTNYGLDCLYSGHSWQFDMFEV